MVLGCFLENCFQATLMSKTNISSVWKEHFSVFCEFLSSKVEIFFWESKTKDLKIFKSKIGHRNLLRKRIWSYLELRNECSYPLKRVFFSFLQIFKWLSWNIFPENDLKGSKLFKSKFSYQKLLRKWFWSYF